MPVTGAYTSQINVQPGDYLKVYVDDGALVLEPEKPNPPSLKPLALQALLDYI